MWRYLAKTVLYTIALLFLMAVGLKVWFVVQQQYVCEPKAKETVRQFITDIASTSFESLSDKSMFIDNDQFVKFQGSISRNYSVEIIDWRRPVEPTLAVRFSPDDSFHFMLVIDLAPLPSCWGTNYEVLTVR
jgi:hypothetical protein